MTDVNMTDFTEGQLQDLLAEVLFAIRGIERENVMIPQEMLYRSQRYCNLCLWRTQILNAISTVKMRETTQAN